MHVYVCTSVCVRVCACGVCVVCVCVCVCVLGGGHAAVPASHAVLTRPLTLAAMPVKRMLLARNTLAPWPSVDAVLLPTAEAGTRAVLSGSGGGGPPALPVLAPSTVELLMAPCWCAGGCANASGMRSSSAAPVEPSAAERAAAEGGASGCEGVVTGGLLAVEAAVAFVASAARLPKLNSLLKKPCGLEGCCIASA